MSTFERFHVDDAGWTDPQPVTALHGAAHEPDGRVAATLAEIEELEQGEQPHGLSDQRWFTILRDLRTFTEQWLDLALGCGWSMRDIYGAPHDLYHRGLDLTGVVLLLDGRPVLSIDANRIIIANGKTQTQTFYRQAPGVSVPFDRERASLVWDTLRKARIRRAEW